jgi:hypothetical protein
VASKGKNKETGKTKIRTTMRPDEEIEVDAAELLDLQRQGLVHEGKPKGRTTAASTEE